MSGRVRSSVAAAGATLAATTLARALSPAALALARALSSTTFARALAPATFALAHATAGLPGYPGGDAGELYGGP